MRHRGMLALAGATIVGCAVASGIPQQWQGRPLYTCCNIRYEDPAGIVDANYERGSLLPFGSAATVTAMTSNSITFRSGTTNYTVTQSYGTEQETSQQYFAKILVDADPHSRFAAYSPSVQAAITDARVERGMTREQVIMSLGYPPTHRTASIDAPLWIYWQGRWSTFTVQFGVDGKVSNIVGNAPSNNEPVSQTGAPTPKPTPTPAKKKSKR